MPKYFSPLPLTLSLLCLAAAPVQAASPVTFVSGKGTNAGTCASPANPCRSFQFAINQTSPGGEVKALDPAFYGPMIINKSIIISGVEGATAGRANGDAITISAGPNDAISLNHLIADGFKVASRAIVFNSGGSLTIAQCTVRNFTFMGIVLQPSGFAKFLIGDTLISDNSGFAMFVVPQGKGSATGTLNHVTINKNFSGLALDGSNGGVDVTAIDSIATNNAGFGYSTQGSFGVLRLAHSVATRNGTGVGIGTGSTGQSFGNNDIRGNTTNEVQGTLTLVAVQ